MGSMDGLFEGQGPGWMAASRFAVNCSVSKWRSVTSGLPQENDTFQYFY